MSLFNHDTTHLAMVVAVCRIGEPDRNRFPPVQASGAEDGA